MHIFMHQIKHHQLIGFSSFEFVLFIHFADVFAVVTVCVFFCSSFKAETMKSIWQRCQSF